MPPIDYGTMAPSHIRERHCHYKELHLWFLSGCAASMQIEGKEITGTEMPDREIEPEGEALVGPKRGLLRPSGIIMVYSPTLFMTLFL